MQCIMKSINTKKEKFMSFCLKSNPVSAVHAYSENTERRRQTEEPNVKTTEHSGIWDKDRMFRMAGFQFKQM